MCIRDRLGYGLAFGLVAIVQASAATALSVYALDLDVEGPVWFLLIVAVLVGVLGMALGLFVSAFASTEFQAVQFMPAFVLPQFLLCGLLVPRDTMDTALRWISNVLPLSYAVDAMRSLTTSEEIDPGTWADLSVVVLAILLALGLGAATLRRRTP